MKKLLWGCGIVLMLLGLVVISLIVVGVSSEDKITQDMEENLQEAETSDLTSDENGTKDATVTPMVVPTATQIPIHVAVGTIVREREANELRAISNWGEQVLHMSGRVQHIAASYIDLSEGGHSDLATVPCRYEEGQLGKVLAVSRDQDLVVRGVYAKKGLSGIYGLNDCVLLTDEEYELIDFSEPVVIEVGDLRRALDANPLRAKAEYQGKHMEMTGYITDFEEDYINLGPNAQAWFYEVIPCRYRDGPEQWLAFDVGALVTVSGTAGEQGLFSDFGLNNCRLIE